MITPRLPAGTTILYRGNPIVISSHHYNYRDDDNLNKLQKAHVRGDLNLYRPIEAYQEQWNHDDRTQTWSLIPGTKKRNDLPPIYMQWKAAYGKLQRL